MSLYKKIIKVMQYVEYLNKDSVVGEGTRASYKGLSEEKVMKVFREAMIKNNLVMIPTHVESNTQSHHWIEENKYGKKNKSSYFTQVSTAYKIIDAETGESETVSSSGHGVDPQDKGAGKAMTYAHKYAILKLFMCPTGDDTDKTHSNEISKELQNKTPLKSDIEKATKEIFGTKEEVKQDGTPVVSQSELVSRCAEMLSIMKEGDRDAQKELMQEITTTDQFAGYKSFKGLNIKQVRVIYGRIKSRFKQDIPNKYEELAKKYNWK